MFEQVLGLPMHVLVIHAAVVFVPLLVVLAVAYATLPRFRSRLDWAVAALVVVAPLTTWVAVQSGEALHERQVERGFSGEILDKLAEHQRYGDALLLYTVPLAVVVALLLVATSGHARVPALPRWVVPVLGVAIVMLGIVTLAYVYLTGHSGADAAWGNTY